MFSEHLPSMFSALPGISLDSPSIPSMFQIGVGEGQGAGWVGGCWLWWIVVELSFWCWCQGNHIPLESNESTLGALDAYTHVLVAMRMKR